MEISYKRNYISHSFIHFTENFGFFPIIFGMHFFTMLPIITVLLKCYFIRPISGILWKHFYYVEFGCKLLLTNFLLPDIELRWGENPAPRQDRAVSRSHLWNDKIQTDRKAPRVLVTDFVYILAAAFLVLIYYRRKLRSEVTLIVQKFSLESEKIPQK